ncbi:sugar-binding transcriptional regulator [Gilliamella sp. ESL0254]|uniref:sugar-binding transcriptional regulator n=1 Tax=Gilliamella sp. ESL0254 TaxID=2705035 RepID=UPI001580D591|nr:sugar-binding transcriptional regulator [Gilliamella sp. ESL0254]NUF26926.1 sugar-binding transcriptional regulator [Gilliamella sp. ESL0254]
MKWEEKRDLVKIATWYYQYGWTQAQIAQKIGISRSIISKKLQEAKDLRIVEVFIKDETAYTVELEKQLEEKFKLEEAIVVATYNLSVEESANWLAKKAAYALNKRITKINKLGISWGKTIRKFVNEFPYITHKELVIVPLIGGMGAEEVDLHSNQICYDLKKKMQCTCKYLYAPALVEDQTMKTDLCKNKYINEVLNEGKSVDMAIVGIANPYHLSTMEEIGYITNRDLEEFRYYDVVGDCNSRFYTSDGSEAKSPINNRVIGLGLDDLRKIPTVVAIVSGENKEKAVVAALNSRIIDIVVMTDKIAEYVLNSNP